MAKRKVAKDAHRPPKWFMVVAILALIWNLVGVFAWFQQASLAPETLAMMPENERALLEAVPGWASTANAIAVFTGTAGALALLVRSRLAGLLFGVSFLAVLAQSFHTLVLSTAREIYGNSVTLLAVAIIVVALYLLLLSSQARNNGWLR